MNYPDIFAQLLSVIQLEELYRFRVRARKRDKVELADILATEINRRENLHLE